MATQEYTAEQQKPYTVLHEGKYFDYYGMDKHVYRRPSAQRGDLYVDTYLNVPCGSRWECYMEFWVNGYGEQIKAREATL